jgi:hypothetical protein
LPPSASPAPTGLACPHWPRLPPWRRGGPGSDARHWSPDVILGFAEYALSFPIYICLSFSLSLLFRQSLLYDSQFNISIRTRLISTRTKPEAGGEIGSVPSPLSLVHILVPMACGPNPLVNRTSPSGADIGYPRVRTGT